MTRRERQILDLIQNNPIISQEDISLRLGMSRSSVGVHISNLMKKGYIAGRGYVLRTGQYAVVAGGANVDIGGQSAGPLLPGDSNPGQMQLSLGGVGRNIAHNLSLLGADVRLLTAVGDDLYGQKICSSCTELGIDISHVRNVAGASTSTYLYITDPAGEMALAVSDMRICQKIDPGYLSANLPLMHHARVVVCDANLPEESLAFLAEECTAPLFCDPVSAAKAEKIRPILGRIHTLKPNRMEAELLSGVTIRSIADARRAARVLLDTGLERVVISLGEDGCLAATRDETMHLPNLPVNMVNTTGCGDAFMAALVWAYLEGLDLSQTLHAARAAAAIAIESPQTINPVMSAKELKARIKQHYNT